MPRPRQTDRRVPEQRHRRSQRQRLPQPLHRRVPFSRREDLRVARVPQPRSDAGPVTVDGSCDAAFAGVREAFAANFDGGLELGASLAISVDGRNVVDLWGGYLDLGRTRPWERDSLVCVFSCTKGVVAIAVMWAVAHGFVDLDAPVASYWPEFAAEGKGDIPVRWLLTHEAGLPAIGRRMPLGSLSDWEAMTDALAAQEPWWEPGTTHGYHGVTFGHLVGEVLRRT